MQKTISILGSGWLGLPLADCLVEKDYSVTISTSNSEKLAKLTSKGYKTALIDIVNKATYTQEFFDCDVLIIAITSKDTKAFEQLIKTISRNSIQQVIFISSTSVYDFCNCEITETSPTNISPIAQIEQLFISEISDKTTILRFSGLFGYNRKPANFFRYKPIPNPNAFVNMIHRDDCIGILEILIENEVIGKQYNAAADTHPTKKEFYTKASLDLGYPAPKILETEAIRFKIISNNSLKNALNYKFKYSDLKSINYKNC